MKIYMSENILLSKNLSNYYMKTQIYRLRGIRDAEKAAADVRSISENLLHDDSLLQPYLEACLTYILPYFKETFSVDTKIQCIDYWLLQPRLDVISELVAALKNPKSKMVAVNYLTRWTKEKIYAKSIEQIRNTGNKELYTELFAIIFSIPDRIATAFHEENQNKDNEKQPFLRKYKPEYFYKKLALSLTHLDSILLSKFAILNLTHYLWMTKFNAPQFAEAALDLQPSAVSPFILSLIEECPHEFATSILSVLYPNVERVKKLINHHFLTQKVLSLHAQDCLIQFLIGQGEVISTLELCGEIWSRHVLITQMSTGLHAQLSHVILTLLDKVTKEQLQNCKATSLIMSGVTAHIGISSPEIRKDGLKIGEKITGILLPDQAVKFDELHPEDDKKEKEEKEIAEKLTSKPPEAVESSSDDDEDLDIDGEWKDGMDFNNNDDDDDDEEPLIPYKIDDDVGSDNLPVLHPRELIKLFRTDENDTERYRKFASAIAAAADVCKRTTALELKNMGQELLTTLINVDNEYNSDDFEDQRRNALVALMSAYPLEVSKLVIAELRKTRDYSLGRRLVVMAAIAYAASELTELPKPEREDIIEGHIRRWGDPKNTRRWGSALHKITMVKSVNRFSPCAMVYFYGLLSGVDLQKLLREEDGLEATQLLTTLAVIIEAAGDSVMELQRMATDLMDVAAILTPVRPPNARKALMFAIACAVRVMKDYRGNDIMGEFLVNAAENDPDEGVRDIAIGICSILAQRHDDDLNNLFKNV